MDYITAAKAFNNPWQALGALIGNVLIKNYKNRGEDKLANSLESSIPSQTAPTEAQVTQQMLQNNAQPREEQVQQNIFEKYKNANPIQTQDPYSIGLEALKNKSTEPLETAALQGAIDKAKGTTPQVTPNEYNAFQDYLRNNVPHMDASGNVSNMGAAANLQAQKQQATAQVGQNNIRPFSVEDWEAQVWAEGRKQGRPDYQIQAVIDRMKPQAEMAERKYNDYRTGEIEKTIFSNIDDPTVTLAGLAEMYKYNPEKAAIYAKGLTTPREQQQQRTQLERSRIGRTGQSGSGGTINKNYSYGNSTKLPTSVQEYLWLEEATKGMSDEGRERLLSDKLNSIARSETPQSSAKMQKFLDTLSPHINKIMSLQNDYDINGSGDALAAINEAINANPEEWAQIPEDTKAEIMQQMYMANAFRQAAIGDLDGYKRYMGALTPDALNNHGWTLNYADINREYNNKHN